MFRKLIKRKPGLKLEGGMTYIEMIVVLGIFSVLSSVAMFNYRAFEDRVDVTNLGNDLALRVVKAQNDSRAGVWTALAPAGWRPAYGVYFEAGSSEDRNFIYFADYDESNGFFDNSGGMNCDGECLDKITLTRGNRISNIAVSADGWNEDSASDVTLVFSRLSAEPRVVSEGLARSNAEVKITAESPKGISTVVTVSPSGRIEVE